MIVTESTTDGSRDGFEEEYPFPSHFLDLDGVRYHYVDEGHGEPLLMVHGNPTWSFAWRNFIKDLSKDIVCWRSIMWAVDFPTSRRIIRTHCSSTF